MVMVDERGRLFGRFNLVDAVVALLVVGLLPLAYGAYVLFRTPPPQLKGIEPAAIASGPNMNVKILGENLRPYMRVSFGIYQGATFTFNNTRQAEVGINEMPAGVYDVVLYDFAQERARLPRAFTVTPSALPDTHAVVVGSFGNLTASRAAMLKAGLEVEGAGTVTAVGTPVPDTTRVYAGAIVEIPVDKSIRMPARLRLSCFLRAPQGSPQCVVGDVVIQATAMLMLKTPIGTLPFQIDQVLGAQPLEQVRAIVRYGGSVSVLSQLRIGDTDRGIYNNELGAGARILAISAPHHVSNDAAQYDVTLMLQAQRGSNGWIYGSNALRLGVALTIRTTRYEVTGEVMGLSPEWEARPQP